MRSIIFFFGFCVALAHSVRADAITAASEVAPIAELSTSDAIILGVIEGVTEFLPISSTGHLIIANAFLKLDGEVPLTNTRGELLWYKKPSAKNPAGEPLTLKLAADTYSVVIQFGAIAAVAGLYWRQMRSMIQGLRGRDPEGLKLLRNLIIAFLPAATLGYVLHDWIDKHLFSIGAVVVAQVGGAVLMFAAEHWRKKHPGPAPSGQLAPRSALSIGALQCAALWPGTSRSMTTIVGGYFAGLDPRKAAEFSFLLGFVTLSAATVYKSMKSGTAMIEVFGWPHVLLGCMVAAITAAISIKFLIRYLTRHGLGIFAVYRLVTAAVLVAWLVHAK